MLCAGERHFMLCLLLVKPRKTRPDMTETVYWDIKNQIKSNKLNNLTDAMIFFIFTCIFIHVH